MTAFKLIAAAVSLALATNASAKTLTIGIDASASNPLVVSEAAAKAAAEYARTEIAKLDLGDFVRVRTFGDRNGAHPSQTIRITRGNRADKVGATVARYIATMPAKKLEGQASTNIVAFLEFGQFDCQAGAAQTLLLTDGIESSAYADGREFLNGKALPAPEPALLKGCDVTMFGFGQNSTAEVPPQIVKTMRASWTDWMKAAGASSFTVVIDP